MELKILTFEFINDYISNIKESPIDKLNKIQKRELPGDYFKFYKSVSSVYSSKIEGEDIDFDSFFKHKFLRLSLNRIIQKKLMICIRHMIILKKIN